MGTLLRAVPGVVVVLVGVLLIVGRHVFGVGSSIARTSITGRASTRRQRKADSFLPVAIGAGVVIAGVWLLTYTYVLD